MATQIFPAAMGFDQNTWLSTSNTHLKMGGHNSAKGCVSFWYQTTSLDGGRIFQCYDSTGTYGTSVNVSLLSQDGLHLYLMLQLNGDLMDGSQAGTAIWETQCPNDIHWHHIVLSWDVTSTMAVSAYLDGTLMTLPPLNATSGDYEGWYTWGNLITLFTGQPGSIDSAKSFPDSFIYAGASKITSDWSIPYAIPPIGDPGYKTHDYGSQNFGGFVAETLQYDASRITVSGGTVTVNMSGTINIYCNEQIDVELIDTVTDDYYGVFVGSGGPYAYRFGLEDGGGTKYYAPAYNSGGDPTWLTETMAVSGSISFTPFFEFTGSATTGGSQGTPFHPAAWGSSEHITGTVEFYSMNTVGLNVSGHTAPGLVIQAQIADPFTIKGDQCDTYQIGTGSFNLAEVWVNLAPFDFKGHLSGELGSFRYSSDGSAVKIGGSGWLPFSVPAGGPVPPQIYCSGDPGAFIMNYPTQYYMGAVFEQIWTINGNPSVCANDPYSVETGGIVGTGGGFQMAGDLSDVGVVGYNATAAIPSSDG